MRRGKPAQQFGTKAIGGFIATLPLRHVQTERRGGHRRSYSFEAGREDNVGCLAEKSLAHGAPRGSRRDRKRVVTGKGVDASVGVGGRSSIEKTTSTHKRGEI